MELWRCRVETSQFTHLSVWSLGSEQVEQPPVQDVPFIHPSASNPDPLCIFSKDNMHQSTQIGMVIIRNSQHQK